jgi:hypothetical protein
MKNTEMIISALISKQGVDTDKTCCLCGGNRTIKKLHSAKDIFSGKFTDYNLLKVKYSNIVCDFCKLALSEHFIKNDAGKLTALRQYSFLVENNKFAFIDFKERFHYLFDHKFTPPFILAFATPGLNKKHISFKSKINCPDNPFYVSTDNLNILFDREKWRPVFETVIHFYKNKVIKSELQSCRIPPWKFIKYNLDINKIIDLKTVKDTEQYQLIVNSLYKELKQ